MFGGGGGFLNRKKSYDVIFMITGICKCRSPVWDVNTINCNFSTILVHVFLPFNQKYHPIFMIYIFNVILENSVKDDPHSFFQAYVVICHVCPHSKCVC